MKLQAVTVCIHYADYLECILANRRHFDRWVIVTVPGDVATVGLCARHGIEVVLSRVLRADGKDLDAAYNKAAVINEGLALLDPDGWALVLDADVLLPRHFGERLEALPLEAGCLYGASGRRVCEDRESLELLRELEPWDRLVGRNTQALGYFNLFHLGHAPNRYPASSGVKSGEHDDFRFTTSFPAEGRLQVPMTVIHAGPTHTNWAQRVSRKFEAEAVTGLDFDALMERVATEAGRGTVEIVGYFPGGRWRKVAERFSEALLVDHFAVDAPSGHPLKEADRGVLRWLCAEEAAGLPHVRRLGAHSVGTLAKIPDASLDALYLPGEVAPSWLVEALPPWLEKLKPGGIIFGDLYGLPHWREATFAISLLIGAPDEAGGDGSWWRLLKVKPRLRSPAPSPDEEQQAKEQDGVVLVNVGKETVAALLLTAHSAREHWPGPVRIYHWGEENESLSIACSRLDVALWNVGDETDGLDACMAEVSGIQPFRRAILLRPGMLVVKSLQGVFEASHHGLKANGAIAFPKVSALFIEDGESRPLPVVNSREFGGEDAAIVFFAGNPEKWSDAAWEVWSLREAAMASAMAAEIRVPADVTIVSVVTAENAGDFQRNWLTWRFRGEPPVVLFFVGISAAELWMPGEQAAPRIVEVPAAQAADARWLLEKVIDLCTTGRVIFLPAGASALPGAELWPHSDKSCPVVFHETAAGREEESITNNRFLPDPFFGMVTLALLKKVPSSRAVGKWSGKPLSFLIRAAAEELGVESAWGDASRAGWKFPQTHHYVRRYPRRPAVETRTITSVAFAKTSLKQLADDVVVISLPERLDRRERIVAMMGKEGVAFRFVEGIRVTDEDIKPGEVAEVGRADFKTVAGWEKYLRGMVGCRRAHLGVLEHAFDAGLGSLLITEDDMTFELGWKERLDAARAELPPGWLQLHFSAHDFAPGEPVSRHLRRLGGAYQTTAILYSEAGIEAALECLRRSRQEIDCWLGKRLHPYGNSYVVHPRISHQNGGASDIMGFHRGITH